MLYREESEEKYCTCGRNPDLFFKETAETLQSYDLLPASNSGGSGLFFKSSGVARIAFELISASYFSVSLIGPQAVINVSHDLHYTTGKQVHEADLQKPVSPPIQLEVWLYWVWKSLEEARK